MIQRYGRGQSDDQIKGTASTATSGFTNFSLLRMKKQVPTFLVTGVSTDWMIWVVHICLFLCLELIGAPFVVTFVGCYVWREQHQSRLTNSNLLHMCANWFGLHLGVKRHRLYLKSHL